MAQENSSMSHPNNALSRCLVFSVCAERCTGDRSIACLYALVWQLTLRCANHWLMLWTSISRILAHGTEHISWPIRMTWTGDLMNPKDEWTDVTSPITQKSVKKTGGRGAAKQSSSSDRLAFAKAQEAPSFMQFATALAWERRWTRMLSTACSLSFAASSVEPSGKCETWCCWSVMGP